MTIVYLSNFFNHHQKFLSDVLYEHLGEGNYYFVETSVIPETQKKLGYHSYDVPYLLQYNERTKVDIDRIIMEADIVQFGEAPTSMIKKRSRAGKIILRDDERRYKALVKYLKWPIYTYNSLFLNGGYLLAASAFAPRDYLLSGMRPGRCFKWGYFPEVKHYEDLDRIFARKQAYRESKGIDVSLLWVARLIDWKHPESTIKVAKFLDRNNIRYELNIIGAGPLEDKMKKLIESNGLSGRVNLLGPTPPEKVRLYMEDSDVFMFTSDQNEGWGATLNESMNSACAVVAGDMIGSVPFLMKDGENGLMFQSKDWEDLAQKVKFLAQNPDVRVTLGTNAYKTMTEKWSPNVAGNNLIALCEALLKGEDTPIAEGPCSKTKIMCSNWRKK